MNKRLVTLLLASVAVLTGCATPQPPVAMSANAFAPASNNYGVVMTAMPVVDTAFPGADCLLCYAAASVANSDLTKHTKTLSAEDLSKLNVQVAAALRKRGANVTMIDTFDLKTLPDSPKGAPTFAAKDFSGMKARYKIDKLLVLQVYSVGVERTYASYFPTSEPKARIGGVAYIVNLADNSLEWYKPVSVMRAADGKWDEPPKFPGLTNAYYQAIELARDEVIKPLAQ